MINKSSPIPIYYQIEEILRNQIEGEELTEQDLIPSERVLSEKYEVSRMTIRQAITNLVNEGLLTREKGKGTFVAAKKMEQPLLKLTGFSEDMKSRDLEPATDIKNFAEVEMTPSESKYLKTKTGAKGYRVSRLRLANQIPMAYEVSTLPKEIFPLLTRDLVSQSFYDYAEKQLLLEIEGAKQTIEPSLANKEESELLQIKKGDPVLILKRVSHLKDGRAFEYVKSVYRGDRYKFITEMKR